jgi:hypothetical protein
MLFRGDKKGTDVVKRNPNATQVSQSLRRSDMLMPMASILRLYILALSSLTIEVKSEQTMIDNKDDKCRLC